MCPATTTNPRAIAFVSKSRDGETAFVDCCVFELESELKLDDAVVVGEKLVSFEVNVDDAVVVGKRLEPFEVNVEVEPTSVRVPPPLPSHVSPSKQHPPETQYSPFGQ